MAIPIYTHKFCSEQYLWRLKLVFESPLAIFNRLKPLITPIHQFCWENIYLDILLTWTTVKSKVTGHTWQIFYHFIKGDNFCDFWFDFYTPNLFWKGVHSKTKEPIWQGVHSERKEFAAKGSKFFPFRVDPFQKGCKYIFNNYLPWKCISPM